MRKADYVKRADNDPLLQKPFLIPGAAIVAAFVVSVFCSGAYAQDPYSGEPRSETTFKNDSGQNTGNTASVPEQPGSGTENGSGSADGAKGGPVYGRDVGDAAGPAPEPEKHGKYDAESTKLKPFQGSQLMIGRNVKPPKKSRKFEIGVDLDVAPLNVVATKARDQIVTQVVDDVCSSSPDPVACKAQAEATVTQVMDTLETLTPAQWDAVRAAAGGDAAALNEALAEAGVSDQGQRNEIIGYVDEYAGTAGSSQERMQAVDAVRAVTSNSAISLLFEPYLNMNFKWVEVSLYTPFAVQVMDSGNEIEMGNISVDVKSGRDWTFGNVVSLGLAGGLQLYLPSGSEGIERSMNSDLFASPKFMFGYMSWAPYLVAGMDLAQFFQLQAHVEMVSMHGVRGANTLSNIQYLKYGTGMIILPKFLFSILMEFNGCKGMNNAPRFDAFFAAAGIQFKIAFFKLSAAVQVPLVDQGRTVWDSGYWTNANYDQLSKFTFMSRLAFTF